MPWIRRRSFRLLLVFITVIGVDLLVLSSSNDITNYRRSFLDALIATSLIFAITAGLILAIINNYVKGLREQFIEQARRVRQLAWDCYDNFVGIDNKEFQTFFSAHIRPLAEKSLREWSKIENLQNWGKGIEDQLMKLLKMDNPPPSLYRFIYRYLLQLEDEMNQLGLLYVKRVSASLHAKNATGVYYLLCFAVAVIALDKVLPTTATLNLAVLNCSAALITYAILELLFVLSFVLQEVREEYTEITDSPDEEEIQNESEELEK